MYPEDYNPNRKSLKLKIEGTRDKRVYRCTVGASVDRISIKTQKEGLETCLRNERHMEIKKDIRGFEYFPTALAARRKHFQNKRPDTPEKTHPVAGKSSAVSRLGQTCA